MMDLFDTTVSAGCFSTLLRLAEVAGLTETLRGEGPLTIFAPTDEAFSSLPQEKKEKLQLPENRGKLTSILTYHIVPETYRSQDLIAHQHLMTIQGEELTFRREKEHIYVNHSRIITTNIQASNGIIHMIDRVLLPNCGEKCSMAESEHQTCNADHPESNQCMYTHNGEESPTLIKGISSAICSGASDAKIMANKFIPISGNIISKSVYGVCYGLSYGLVFPTMLLVSILPTNNAFCHGLADGARAANDSVSRLRAKGLRTERPVHTPITPSFVPSAT